jgi:nucleoside-diphosphate-sugar epimerase
MRALVTGATGFLGGLLAEHLAAAGHRVTALVRDPSKARELEALGVRLETADLERPLGLERALDGQEVVFHVAGLIKARRAVDFTRVNVEGTRALVGAAERVRVPRLVHVSSMSAAGPAARGRPLTGDEPARPQTPYGRSKLDGERVVRESGLAWTILRPPMAYGPRDREVLRVFRACRRGVVPVFGDGRQELCAAFGPDVADALAGVATSDRAVGRTYYVCHPETFTSERFAREVGRAVGRAVRIVRVPILVARLGLWATGLVARLAGRATLLHSNKASELLAEAWTADPTPLERDTGWSARHDLRSGLALTAAWYRARGWLSTP